MINNLPANEQNNVIETYIELFENHYLDDEECIQKEMSQIQLWAQAQVDQQLLKAKTLAEQNLIEQATKCKKQVLKHDKCNYLKYDFLTLYKTNCRRNLYQLLQHLLFAIDNLLNIQFFYKIKKISFFQYMRRLQYHFHMNNLNLLLTAQQNTKSRIQLFILKMLDLVKVMLAECFRKLR